MRSLSLFLPLLLLSLSLSGCTDAGPAALQAENSRPWTAVPCDPHPTDRIPVNARVVPALEGNLTDVAPRVAAALGQESAVLNVTEAHPRPGDWSGWNPEGMDAPTPMIPGSLHWDTPSGRLVHETLLMFGPAPGPDGMVVDLTDPGSDPDQPADPRGTWVHRGTAPGLPDEASLERDLRALYAGLGADPETLHFDLWVYNGTSHEPYHDEARALVQQWFGNHSTHPSWWGWNVEADGNVTVRQDVGPLYAFDDVEWMAEADLLDRVRAFTACVLAGSGVDADALGYGLRDAFVADGTVLVQADAHWTEERCGMFPVLTTYLDAQAGVVYETPWNVATECLVQGRGEPEHSQE